MRERENRFRDLGGLVMEMYRQDSFREHLLFERCAELAQIEERLLELELLLDARRPPAARCDCGAPIFWGSHFCANCGRAGRRGDQLVHELRARSAGVLVVLPGLRHCAARPRVSAVQPLERECPDCGASTNRGQEYCLECGHRLPADPAAAGLPRGRLAPGGPWLALLATAAVALIAASTVVRPRARRPRGRRFDADRDLAAAGGPARDRDRARRRVGAHDRARGVLPSLPRPPPTASPRAARRLIAWPRDGSGWTIVLASVPAGPGNRAVAIRQARDAVDQGLRHVGVLTSSGSRACTPATSWSSRASTRTEAPLSRHFRAPAAGYNAGYTREIVP